jgi:transposase
LREFIYEPNVEARSLSSHVQGGYDPQGREELSDTEKRQVLNMVIIGIDIAKYTHEATLMDENGQVLRKPFSFQNSFAGFGKLMTAAKACADSPADLVFGMEATGHYWFGLYAHLRNTGSNIHVINPIQTDALRGLYIRQTKNDARDSFVIADLIRIGRYTKTTLSEPDLLALRELCRHRFFFVDMVSDLKRKVIALLDQVFPEYQHLFSDVFGTTSTELLLQYSTPEEILAVDTDKLCNILSTASRGRLSYEKAVELRQAAQNSFGIMLIADTMGLLIKQMLEQIKFIESQILDLEHAIAAKFSGFGSCLSTITGIGDTMASVIFSEIGDISRFDSSAKLAAFAGVDPTVTQSGEFTGTRAKMSKRGSPYLRRAIWLASTSAVFHDPAIRAFYDKKRSEGKSHMTAIGHVCRKMVSIIFAVMRDNKPYVPVFNDSSLKVHS